MWFFANAAEKAAKNVLDKDNGLLTQVGNWVGGLNLTDEEIMENNTKIVLQVQEFVKATLDESTDRSKSRRSIAVSWFRLQIALVVITAIAIPFSEEIAKTYFDLATSTLMLSVTSAITVFFFGSYGLARHNQTKKKED